MKSTLINEKRNEYRFELTPYEVARRICACLKPTNPNLEETDIKRNPNAKEYKAHYVDEWGFGVDVSVGIGNLKRYFGSRLIKLLDDGGMEVRRVVPKNTHLTKRSEI